MTGAHRRRPDYRRRYAWALVVASVIVIAVGLSQQAAAPAGQPTPTSDPTTMTFRAPPRMPLGTRPPVSVP